jgi:hypothetical protein
MTIEQALLNHEHRQAQNEHRWDCMSIDQKATALSKEPLRSWMETRVLQLFVECNGDTQEFGRRISLMVNDYIDEI